MSAPVPNAACPCGAPYHDDIMPHVKAAHVRGQTVFCPFAGCTFTGNRGRHNDVVDHLVRAHYYYQPSDPNKGTSKKPHLRRLEKSILIERITLEYGHLEALKGDARDFERSIAAADPGFVPQHGLSTVAGGTLGELKARTREWLVEKLSGTRVLVRDWTRAIDWLQDEAARRDIPE